MPTQFLAAQVVRHPAKDEYYYVSTINRDSSAQYYPHRYAETIVWEWDNEIQKKGRILYQDEAGEWSVRSHNLIIEKLQKNGIEAFQDNDTED